MNSTARNIFARRDLLFELVRTDLEASTAGKILGWFWWLLDPMIMIGVYWVFIVIVFGRDAYEPYALFIGCALLSWKHLSTSVSNSVKTLRSKQGLIKSTPFPTILLPLSQVGVNLIYCAVGIVVLVAISIAMGNSTGVHLVQIVPLLVLQTMLVAGIALLMACVGVMVRDMESLVSHVFRVGWYLSPGIYGADIVRRRLLETDLPISGESLMQLYMLNPAAILFTGYRAAIHDPHWLSGRDWLVLSVEAILMLALGYAIYNRYDRRVIKFI